MGVRLDCLFWMLLKQDNIIMKEIILKKIKKQIVALQIVKHCFVYQNVQRCIAFQIVMQRHTTSLLFEQI